MKGYILNREIPNIGKWINFSPSNLQKKQIEIPKPIILTYIILNNQWKISKYIRW